jgi:predicted transcriptional regulator of viral defense system
MDPASERQRDRAIGLLSKQGMARLSELIDAGVTAATISRMERKGEIIRLARGLYQLPDAPLDAHHSLAEAARLVPNGVICLESALAFYELIDRTPRSVSMAIGPRDWRPRISKPPILIFRFGPAVFTPDGEPRIFNIEGVPVPIYGPAKTIVDKFRVQHIAGVLYRESFGYNLNTAIEGMRNALRERKATPAEIAKFAMQAGPRTWNLVRPYLETLIADA